MKTFCSGNFNHQRFQGSIMVNLVLADLIATDWQTLVVTAILPNDWKEALNPSSMSTHFLANNVLPCRVHYQCYDGPFQVKFIPYICNTLNSSALSSPSQEIENLNSSTNSSSTIENIISYLTAKGTSVKVKCNQQISRSQKTDSWQTPNLLHPTFETVLCDLKGVTEL